MTANFLIDEATEAGRILGKGNIDTLKACLQCGRCTASCPSGRLTALRVRRIFLKTLLDIRDLLSDENLWYCTTCYTCHERCPRGVKTTDIIRAIRNVAVKNSLMSESHRNVIGYVLKTGHAVPINDETMKFREKLGLEQIPPTTHKYKDALENIRRIVRRTEFDKLVGLDQEETE